MNHKLSCLFLFLSFAMVSQAQDSCACCTSQYTQFNFWVGEWNVYDTAGILIGESSIAKLEDNCIISEKWTGAKGSSGRSYNYHNAKDSSWNQIWIDSKGGNLVLKGNGGPNTMVLQDELQLGKNNNWHRNRISWDAKDDGSVTQLWERVGADGQVLSVLFLGIYRKK